MTVYRISEIYRTMQGEGWWAGMPCTLVRFQGCNLSCPFCDTKESIDQTSGEQLNLLQLFNRISDVHVKGQMILITGGEPTLQPLEQLVKVLYPLGPVHLETNGTQPLSGDVMFNWTAVSPKITWCGEDAKPVQSMLGRADEIKWLVGKEQDIEELKAFLEEVSSLGFADGPFKRVTLQPISQSGQATEIAYQACLEYGWRLSLQMHKYLGKP